MALVQLVRGCHRWLLLLTLLAGAGAPVAAERLRPQDVPEPLKPWTAWVLAAHPDFNCPVFANRAGNKRCVWPARLTLDLTSHGGEFRGEWVVYSAATVVLPGDQKTWPLAVSLNGNPIPVFDQGGYPAVRLAPGQHRLRGRFTWTRVPDAISIPADIGLLDARMNGTAVRRASQRDSGRLWLRADADPDKAGDATRDELRLTVLRRLVDSNPFEVLTRIELEVAGATREQRLGRALLPDFIPVALNGGLPARLEPDGGLTVQLRPGRHTLEIRARHPAFVTRLDNPAQPPPWPATETWAFDARHAIRVVEVEGGQAIDPRQTRVPDNWQHLPTYIITANDVMTFTVRQRGNPDPEPDQLALERTLWLDFDGGAYTVHDKLSGEINRHWRLDSGPALRLGQVRIDGEPRFITRLGPTAPAGVEIRRGTLRLEADGRLDNRDGQFAASGWAHDFQSASATLRVPPGWDVFAIAGVDNLPDTWLNRWTLLDLFFVLIIAAAVYRLHSARAGALALVAMTLIWHAPDAPRQVWLHLLIAIALLRVLPQGTIAVLVRLWRNGAALILILLCVVFISTQLRALIYPQLPADGARLRAVPVAPPNVAERTAEAEFMAQQADAIALDEDFADNRPAAVSAMPKAARKAGLLQSGTVSTGGATDYYAHDPNAVVQTGPGLPDWRWRDIRLRWNGPVPRTQTVEITYLTPAMNRLLHGARVAGLLALLWLLLRLARGDRGTATGTPGSLAALCVVLAVSWTGPAQAAGFPDPALLQELEQRLLAPPPCNTDCAVISDMIFTLDPGRLSIEANVDAVAPASIALPGNRNSWLPEEVSVNGAAARDLALDDSGTLWLRLEAGVHRVALGGALAGGNNVQIALPQRPRRARLRTAAGWTVDGFRADGSVQQQLVLTRAGAGGAATPAPFETSEPPPFVRFERTLNLGLEWTIQNRLVRAQRGGPALVTRIPLLPGESVVAANVDIAAGEVEVSLPRGQNAIAWESVLERHESITLEAHDSTTLSETWRLRASPVWHVETDGIAPIQHQGGGHWLPEWRPWPGETLTLAVTRPAGIAGRTLTIDTSSLITRAGKRSSETELEARVRSSQGGQYTMTLPEGAALQSISVNGRDQSVRLADNQLTVPLAPGAQTVSLSWREEPGVAAVLHTPSIGLGVDSINHRIRVKLAPDRWVLWTGGPRLGPAVLFWSVLAAIVLLALGLGRLPLTPLGTREWLLLLVGLSQVEIPLAAIVVGWLLAFSVREQHGHRLSGARFNLVQIALTVLTVAALAILLEAIRGGLLGHPQMHVAGNQSSALDLHWYADRVAASPPTAWVISVPLLVYRVLMLAWALWLAFALLRWLRWAWSAFAAGGLWQRWRQARPAAPADDAAAPAPAD